MEVQLENQQVELRTDGASSIKNRSRLVVKDIAENTEANNQRKLHFIKISLLKLQEHYQLSESKLYFRASKLDQYNDYHWGRWQNHYYYSNTWQNTNHNDFSPARNVEQKNQETHG